MESYMQMLAKRSKDASRSAAKLGTADKNRGLLAVADELVAEQQLILDANAKDIEAAKKKGVKQSLIDRLELSERRIAGKFESTWACVASFPDQHTDLSGSCLSAGNDPFRKEYESDEFYRIDLYSPDVDEFPAPYTGMADTA